MTKEKSIIDNLKYSEEWFLQAYGKLKTACGGGHALVDVDFKEFNEILDCIKDIKQMNEVLKIVEIDVITESLPNLTL